MATISRLYQLCDLVRMESGRNRRGPTRRRHRLRADRHPTCWRPTTRSSPATPASPTTPAGPPLTASGSSTTTRRDDLTAAQIAHPGLHRRLRPPSTAQASPTPTPAGGPGPTRHPSSTGTSSKNCSPTPTPRSGRRARCGRPATASCTWGRCGTSTSPGEPEGWYTDPTAWVTRAAGWHTRLFADDTFADAVAARWPQVLKRWRLRAGHRPAHRRRDPGDRARRQALDTDHPTHPCRPTAQAMARRPHRPARRPADHAHRPGGIYPTPTPTPTRSLL